MKSNYSGFVLGTKKFKDNLKIVSLFMAEAGCQSFLIRISKTKPTHHIFQPLNKIQGVADNQTESLRILSNAELLSSYKEIPFQAAKSTVALFVCEFLYRVLPEHYPNSGVFDLIDELASVLDEPFQLSSTVPAFMVKFCLEMGILDQAESFKKSTDQLIIEAVNSMIELNYRDASSLNLSKDIRMAIIHSCIYQCESAFEKNLSIKSLDMFQEVFH